MNFKFEPSGAEHQKPVMEIFNYYIAATTAAFPDSSLPEAIHSISLETCFSIHRGIKRYRNKLNRSFGVVYMQKNI